MNRTVIGIFLLTFVSVAGFAQNAPEVLYAESFRRGPTHITQESYEVKLDPQNRTFRQRIKDAQGSDRYVFTLAAQGPEGDTKVTSWQARLEDLHHSIYSNILLASQDEDSSDPRNSLWRLEPGRFSVVPVTAKRIIKVDSFYVVLQVKSPIDSPYLDSMTVEVRFSNTDPRAERSEIP